MITLKIDDIETTVADGTLILEAAKAMGIEIPHFCYHPKLSISGNCRMCLVEVEGMPKLVTACTTPVVPDMSVKTRSDKVREAQRGILALLLINHPLDCPICDKGGECPLQDFTYRYGPGKSEFYDKKWHFEKPVDLSPLIVLDRERCILCTRCVRFQEEVAAHPELEVVERGRGAYIETTRPEGFISNFSGNTIDLCPVGALTSRPFRFKARPWELKRSPSICPHCGCGCNIYLDVRDNNVMRVLARENPMVDDGWLCDRGCFGYLFVNHPDRLKTPLIKKGEVLVPCTWKDAINFAVDGIVKAKERFGSECIGGLASPHLTNEDLYIFKKFMKDIIGSNSIVYSLNGDFIIESLGSTDCAGFRKFSFQDIDEADIIFLIEGDPSRDLPILDLRIKKAVKRGVRLYVAGPEEIELSSFAVAHIRSVGWGHRSSERSSELVDLLSGEIKDSKKCLILFGKKIDTDEARSLCHHIKRLHHGREEKGQKKGWISMGVLLSENNARGAQDMGMTSLRNQSILGELKCLIIAGRELPGIADLRNRLDFLVVYDLFPSDTARVADVVLPAAAFSEIDGIYTNSERRVQRLFKTTSPPGDAKPLWEAIMLIANAMGSEWVYSSSQDVMQEISERVPFYRYITYEAIGMKGIYADGTTEGPRYYR